MQIYIKTVSGPKLVTILNLVTPSSPSPSPSSYQQALRTIQYLLTFTVATGRDSFTVLSPGVSQQPASAASYLDGIQEATERNIQIWNNSIEEAIQTNSEIRSHYEPISVDGIKSLLTAQNDNHTLPCLRALLVILEEDISSELAATLLKAADVNPEFQVFFFSVRSPDPEDSGTVVGQFPNMDTLLCRIRAVFESSDVDMQSIANRASNVQSYLNYLSFSGQCVATFLTM